MLTILVTYQDGRQEAMELTDEHVCTNLAEEFKADKVEILKYQPDSGSET